MPARVGLLLQCFRPTGGTRTRDEAHEESAHQQKFSHLLHENEELRARLKEAEAHVQALLRPWAACPYSDSTSTFSVIAPILPESERPGKSRNSDVAGPATGPLYQLHGYPSDASTSLQLYQQNQPPQHGAPNGRESSSEDLLRVAPPVAPALAQQLLGREALDAVAKDSCVSARSHSQRPAPLPQLAARGDAGSLSANPSFALSVSANSHNGDPSPLAILAHAEAASRAFPCPPVSLSLASTLKASVISPTHSPISLQDPVGGRHQRSPLSASNTAAAGATVHPSSMSVPSSSMSAQPPAEGLTSSGSGVKRSWASALTTITVAGLRQVAEHIAMPIALIQLQGFHELLPDYSYRPRRGSGSTCISAGPLSSNVSTSMLHLDLDQAHHLVQQQQLQQQQTSAQMSAVQKTSSLARNVLNVSAPQARWDGPPDCMPACVHPLRSHGAAAVYLNEAYIARVGQPSLALALEGFNEYIIQDSGLHRQLIGFAKSMYTGNPQPTQLWKSDGLFRGVPTSQKPQGLVCVWLHPCILLDPLTGHTSCAALVSTETNPPISRQIDGLLREHTSLKYTTCIVQLINLDGSILTQNAEAVAAFGCRASSCLPPDWVSTVAPLNYLGELLMADAPEVLARVESLGGRVPYKQRVQVISPLLLQLLGADTGPRGCKIWHEVDITRLLDPVTHAYVYCVVQVDISDIVAAEHQVLQLQQQQQSLLVEILPQQVIDHLLANNRLDGFSQPGTGYVSPEPWQPSQLQVHADLLDAASQLPSLVGQLPASSTSLSNLAVDLRLENISSPQLSHAQGPPPQHSTSCVMANGTGLVPGTAPDSTGTLPGSGRPSLSSIGERWTRMQSAHSAPLRSASLSTILSAAAGVAAVASLHRQPSTSNTQLQVRGGGAATGGDVAGGSGNGPNNFVCNARLNSTSSNGSVYGGGGGGAIPMSPLRGSYGGCHTVVYGGSGGLSAGSSMNGSLPTAARSMSASASGREPAAMHAPTQGVTSAGAGGEAYAHLGGGAMHSSTVSEAARTAPVPTDSTLHLTGTGGDVGVLLHVDGSLAGSANEQGAVPASGDRLSSLLQLQPPGCAGSSAPSAQCLGVGREAAAACARNRSAAMAHGGTPCATLLTSGSNGSPPAVLSATAEATLMGSAPAHGSAPPATAACTAGEAGRGGSGGGASMAREASRSGGGASGTSGTASQRGSRDKSGRIWLTQQDVMSLATYHEQATIMFTDIKGFTAMSEQLAPTQVMLFLNQLYSVFDSLLDTFEVYKVETIGDSYMVAGGLFSIDSATGSKQLGGLDPNHAANVVGFASAVLEACHGLMTPLGQPVDIRVGVHSGSVVSGVVGQKMPRFCLYGSCINIASRMESLGVPGSVHASDATRQLLPHLPWQPTGGVYAKGKGIMYTYLLQSSSATPGDAACAPHRHPEAEVTNHDPSDLGTMVSAPPLYQTSNSGRMSDNHNDCYTAPNRATCYEGSGMLGTHGFSDSGSYMGGGGDTSPASCRTTPAMAGMHSNGMDPNPTRATVGSAGHHPPPPLLIPGNGNSCSSSYSGTTGTALTSRLQPVLEVDHESASQAFSASSRALARHSGPLRAASPDDYSSPQQLVNPSNPQHPNKRHHEELLDHDGDTGNAALLDMGAASYGHGESEIIMGMGGGEECRATAAMRISGSTDNSTSYSGYSPCPTRPHNTPHFSTSQAHFSPTFNTTPNLSQSQTSPVTSQSAMMMYAGHMSMPCQTVTRAPVAAGSPTCKIQTAGLGGMPSHLASGTSSVQLDGAHVSGRGNNSFVVDRGAPVLQEIAMLPPNGGGGGGAQFDGTDDALRTSSLNGHDPWPTGFGYSLIHEEDPGVEAGGDMADPSQVRIQKVGYVPVGQAEDLLEAVLMHGPEASGHFSAGVQGSDEHSISTSPSAVLHISCSPGVARSQPDFLAQPLLRGPLAAGGAGGSVGAEEDSNGVRQHPLPARMYHQSQGNALVCMPQLTHTHTPRRCLSNLAANAAANADAMPADAASAEGGDAHLHQDGRDVAACMEGAGCEVGLNGGRSVGHSEGSFDGIFAYTSSRSTLPRPLTLGVQGAVASPLPTLTAAAATSDDATARCPPAAAAHGSFTAHAMGSAFPQRGDTAFSALAAAGAPLSVAHGVHAPSGVATLGRAGSAHDVAANVARVLAQLHRQKPPSSPSSRLAVLPRIGNHSYSSMQSIRPFGCGRIAGGSMDLALSTAPLPTFGGNVHPYAVASLGVGASALDTPSLTSSAIGVRYNGQHSDSGSVGGAAGGGVGGVYESRYSGSYHHRSLQMMPLASAVGDVHAPRTRSLDHSVGLQQKAGGVQPLRMARASSSDEASESFL